MVHTLFRLLARRILLVIALLTATALSITICPPAQAAMNAIQGGTLPDPLPLFPPNNWWNRDISSWPVDPNSASYISFINNGGTRHLHPDFGGDAPTQQDPYGIYGMPYVVVSGATPADLVAVDFYYSSESDGVDHGTDTSARFYPIPIEARTQPRLIEGGAPGTVDLRSSQDRHLLIVDYDRNMLYELYNVYYNEQIGKWYAGSGAFFDMNTNDRRPDGWTSADAAGLAILPGLVRHDEVYDPNVTEIRHALRVTVRATNGYVYPASHRAGATQGALPMGARLRLKASVDVTHRTSDPNIQKIFRAMQTFGLIVADNGSDMFITGTYDPRWDNDILNPAFSALTASDFEAIQLGYNPSVELTALSSVSVSPSSIIGGQVGTGTVSLTAAAPVGGIVVGLASSNPAATVPASVTVNANATSANFTVTTSPVGLTTAAAITATYDGASKAATLTIKPFALSALTLIPSTGYGGSTSTGTVRLSGAAPYGGIAVTLSSSKPTKATVPAAVTVAAGTTVATFTINIAAVASKTSATISASYNGVSRKAILTIQKKRAVRH